jgi:hypothetical protein
MAAGIAASRHCVGLVFPHLADQDVPAGRFAGLGPKAFDAARVSVSNRLRLWLAPWLCLIVPSPSLCMLPVRPCGQSGAPHRRCRLGLPARFRPRCPLATVQSSHLSLSRASLFGVPCPVDSEDNGDGLCGSSCRACRRPFARHSHAGPKPPSDQTARRGRCGGARRYGLRSLWRG